MDQLVHNLKYDQITLVYPPLGSGLVLDYSMFFNWLFPKLYFPKQYDDIVKVIEGLFRRDGTAFIEAYLGASLEVLAAGIAAQSGDSNSTSSTSTLPAAVAIETPIVRAVWGIRCGDRRQRSSSRAELEPEIAQLEANSRWFAHFGVAPNGYLCAQWPFEAAERYEGGFAGVRTRNPVLFVGNTFDPVTPLASARNMSAGFEGSIVLQHDSYGVSNFDRI